MRHVDTYRVFESWFYQDFQVDLTSDTIFESSLLLSDALNQNDGLPLGQVLDTIVQSAFVAHQFPMASWNKMS